ncbi:hypothetical protein FOA52_001887 [Chlamydomonas sp. UWO 241]|nr:hypothetical protein FOA52_001887 [Chlamydomonas sp. UWO 241]
MHITTKTKSTLQGSGRVSPASLSHHAPSRPLARPLFAEPAGKSQGRQPWPVDRFASTVTFFNQPPSLASVMQTVFVDTPSRVIRTVLGGSKAEAGALVDVPCPTGTVSPIAGLSPRDLNGAVLVTGADSPTGAAVVGRLLLAGHRVRALVDDASTRRFNMLPAAPGAKLQVARIPQGPISRAITAGARVVIMVDTGSPGAPRSPGGAAAHASAERQLLDAVSATIGRPGGLTLLSGDGGGPVAWGALDDVVMGGVSLSEIVQVPGEGEAEGAPAMVFRGTVSTSNSGGFASVRCRNFDPALDVAGYDGIEMRLKGDGQRYKLILRCDPGWDSIAYCHSFSTVPGEWQTVRVPFADFLAVFRAQTLRDGAPVDAASLFSVQLMLSKFEYDGGLNPEFRAGAFSLPISRISAYVDAERPRAPRVLVLSALGAVGGLEAGLEGAVRGSGVSWAVLHHAGALTDARAGGPLALAKAGGSGAGAGGGAGGISRADAADLACALLGQPAAAGVTLEVAAGAAGSPGFVHRDWGAMLASAGLASDE